MKTFKIYTLGCKVNQYESEVIREQFKRRGFTEIDNGQPADNYIVNTCTVTQRADSESLGIIRRAMRENPDAKVVVTGCLVVSDKHKIKNSFPRNLTIKSKDKLLTPSSKLIASFKGHNRAFLKIQDGCNNFCSYCKVPLVRGESRSRSLDEIKKEAQNLVKNGFKEIVLCGICLGSYGKDLSPKKGLVDAISALENIEGEFRIRLSSIEAKDVTPKLINKLKASKKLCPHLHIPIQGGDNEILKRMNRKYTSEYYLDLVRNIKDSIANVAITTDVLVGFPGEKEKHFHNTVKLIKEIIPLRTHIFPYSRRKGTIADSLKDHVAENIIHERIIRLRNIAEEASFKYRQGFLNKKLEVLVEDDTGYTQNYIRVRLKADCLRINTIVPVRITKVSKKQTIGEIV